MVRKYKKAPGTRNYKTYPEETLNEALEQIKNYEMTINAASLHYHIPFGTLYNKFKGLHGNSPGGQTVFSHEEEVSILNVATKCADWGFPLTQLDLRYFAKAYLDKRGREVARFSNNLPGVEWADSLLKRHKDSFGQRLSSNLTRSRTTLGRDSIKKYFNRLESVLKSVPPSNIFTYDEINMADDPGNKTRICRRGVKYPEKDVNFTKSSSSVMICGSADGTLLPPYVIYKSTHLYDTWKERGIAGRPCCEQSCCSQGTRYNTSTSGWIDAAVFRDWFRTCFLPHNRRLDGRSVLIGDNLSFHPDNDIIAVCESNNISFVCLVPNSTHLCQPLDVGFFRPMKTVWRETLEHWKKVNQRATTVPKESFPSLLRQAILDMNKNRLKKEDESKTSTVKRNLISGFKETGIYPLDKEGVLRKLSEDTATLELETVIRDSLNDFFRERNGRKSEPARKKKKLDFSSCSSDQSDEQPEVSSASYGDLESITKRKIPTISPNSTIDEPSTSKNHANTPGSDDDVTDCESKTELEYYCPKNPEIGQFILAKIRGRKGKKTYKYVCCIEEINDNKLVVQVYKSHNKSRSIFLEIANDMTKIKECDIVSYLPTPILKNKKYVFPNEIMINEF